MYYFRNISFRLFVLILVMPVELVGIVFSSIGQGVQLLSNAVGEALYHIVLGDSEKKIPKNQDITQLMDLKKTSSDEDE